MHLCVSFRHRSNVLELVSLVSVLFYPLCVMFFQVCPRQSRLVYRSLNYSLDDSVLNIRGGVAISSRTLVERCCRPVNQQQHHLTSLGFPSLFPTTTNRIGAAETGGWSAGSAEDMQAFCIDENDDDYVNDAAAGSINSSEANFVQHDTSHSNAAVSLQQ